VLSVLRISRHAVVKKVGILCWIALSVLQKSSADVSSAT
jgi:hypothetical protein